MTQKQPHPYNDPFAFAMGSGDSRSIRQAVDHIRTEFGITGELEHVRSERDFRLFQLRNLQVVGR